MEIRGLFFTIGEACTSVLPSYIIVTLPDDGCNYKPKHFVVNVINENAIIYIVVLPKINGHIQWNDIIQI